MGKATLLIEPGLVKTSTPLTSGDIVIGAGGTTVTDSGVALSSLVRKYATAFSAATSVTVTHNLNTLDVVVKIWDSESPPNELFAERCEITSVNVVTLTFGAAQTGRVVVIG